VVSEFRTEEYEVVNESGKRTNPFEPATQRITKIFVTLND